MESSEDHHDQPTSEKLIISTTTDGDDDEQGSSHHNKVTPIKSYECNFCKRGFSNAQALGGHMNIHRKDKARLKQQQQQPLDIIHQHQILNPNMPYWNVSHHHHSQSREENLVIDTSRKHFPLFVESTDSREPPWPPEGQRAPEIDLELRLGNDPQHDSSTGTRKFL